MDIDILEQVPEIDLKELMALPRIDEKDEVDQANQKITSVLKSLGANAQRSEVWSDDDQ